MTYDVVLIRKYAASKTHTGFGGLENFLLNTLIKDIREACDFARSVGSDLDLPVLAEKELVKFLKFNPLAPVASNKSLNQDATKVAPIS